MRSIIVVGIALTLCACAGAPQKPQLPGGQKVIQPGISFVVPENNSWSVMVQSTYQVALGAKGNNPDETYIVGVSNFQIPKFASAQDFLAYVKAGRAGEPQTGRFEIVRNDEQLFSERIETCVKHETESKDYGAKRGKEFSVIQYVGMNCIHPKNAAVGVSVELSRKAPPNLVDSQFTGAGMKLLRSVEFSAFK